jgi:hypothetical protein
MDFNQINAIETPANDTTETDFSRQGTINKKSRENTRSETKDKSSIHSVISVNIILYLIYKMTFKKIE